MKSLDDQSCTGFYCNWRYFPSAWSVSLAVLVAGAAMTAVENGADLNAWVIFGVCVCGWGYLWRGVEKQPCESGRRWGVFLRFALLAAATAVWSLGGDIGWVFWLVACAWIADAGSWSRRFGLWTLSWILLIWLPHLTVWNWFLSYPLRLLSTAGCAWTLQALGWEVSAAGTELYWYGNAIAITTACSGIEQLEALLLIGLVLVHIQQRDNGRRVAQYLCIVPAVLIANTLRLAATLLAERVWGDAVFLPLPHQLLGLAMIGCAFLLLYGAGVGIAMSAGGGRK